MRWFGYLYFTTGGEKIYHKVVKKPSKIKGFRYLTNAYIHFNKEKTLGALLRQGVFSIFPTPQILRFMIE